MDRINELLARLGELTDAELSELDGLIIAEAERLADEDATADNVTALQGLADGAEHARAESGKRAEQAAERHAAREAALARLRPVATADDEDEGEDEGPEPQPGEVPGDPQPADPTPVQEPPPGEYQPGGPGDPVNPAGDNPEPQYAVPQERAVAAAARPSRGAVAARRPAAASPRPAARPASLVAAADVPGFSAGQRINNSAELAEAFLGRMRGLGRGGADGEQVLVASAHRNFPNDRQLTSGSPGENTRRLDAVLGRQALTAAGGLCAPIPTLYDVDVLGSSARPLRDALPSFQASRGGIEWRGNIAPSSLAAGVGTWTLQNDIDAATAGAPDPVKPIVEITCPGLTQAYIEAITLRIRFRNVMSRFDPEVVAANNEAAQVAFAQFSERRLLEKMDAALLSVTYPTKVLGATRDLLALVDKVVASFRDRYRLDSADNLRVMLPRWVRDLIRTDITRSHTLGLDSLAVTDAQITSWFTQRGVAVTWLMDGPDAQAQVTGPPLIPAITTQRLAAPTAGAAVPPWPDNVLVRVFREGDFFLLDAGVLDLGLVRDSGLNAVNAYETFYEEFLNVAWRGVEGLRVSATVHATGEVAGTANTSAVND